MRLRITLRADGMWQYSVQHLGPGDFAEEFEFDKCFNSSCRLLFTSCLLTKRHSIVPVSTTHNSYVSSDENPHAIVESNFHLRYTVCVCCAILDDHVISHFVVEGHLRGVYLRFLVEELPELCEDVPVTKRGRSCFLRDGACPYFAHAVRNFLNDNFPGRWIGSGVPHNWPARFPDLSPLGGWIDEWVEERKKERKKERNGLQPEGWNARPIARSHFGYGRSYQEQPVEAATCRSHCLQPSGEVRCGRGWYFRKPALSTGHWKLKGISC